MERHQSSQSNASETITSPKSSQYYPIRFSTPHSKNHRSSPQRQPQKHQRRSRKQTKPNHNPIRRRLQQRMRNPKRNIPPSSINSRIIVHAQVRERQSRSNKICRLLVQVVEILRRPLALWRQHGFHARLVEARVHAHFVLAQGRQAFGVHPAFHYEGPEVEGYEGREEGGGRAGGGGEGVEDWHFGRCWCCFRLIVVLIVGGLVWLD